MKDPSVQDNEHQEFIGKLCHLITLMLEPQMKKRIAIDSVVAKMGEIFPMKDPEVVEVPADSLKASDEKVLIDLKYTALL